MHDAHWLIMVTWSIILDAHWLIPNIFVLVSGTPIVEGGGEEGKTLKESAAELTQQTNSNKRKYDEVAVVTGRLNR